MVELEVTWGRTLRVWWAYLWRNLLAIILSGAVGFVGSLLVTFAMIGAGASHQSAAAVVGPASVVLGLAFSLIPFKLILGKDFGEFRLALVSTRRPMAMSEPIFPDPEPFFADPGPVPDEAPPVLTRRGPPTFGKRV